MRTFMFSLLGVAMLTANANATTKTVSQAGDGDFTSIQAAIDSFTEAEITDGEPDEVVILDGATYDEQVMLGKLPRAENVSAGFLDEAIALNSDRDPFTLRGADPENRPVVNPTTGPAIPYGVWNSDPGDTFTASFSFMGKDFTVANIEIRTDGSVGEYGANGQAGNMVFDNVLFGRAGSSQEGDSLLNLNNDSSLINDGFDNSYTFRNCTWDGTVGESERYGESLVYLHGYGDDNPGFVDEGLTPEQATAVFTFENCAFINASDATRIRGNEQANEVTVTGTFMTGSGNGFVAEGRGTFTIENSIFYQNTNLSGEFGNDNAVIHTDGRAGATPVLNVRNNLFIENLDPIEFEDAAGFNTRASVIRIENDGEDQLVTIDNNTFVSNPIVFRFSDSQFRERNAVINSNIFQDTAIVLTGSDGPNETSYPLGTPEEAGMLMVNGEGNVFDGVDTVVEEGDLLPNVTLNGTEGAVEFSNTEINADAPFAGPPFQIVSGADDAGANLGGPTAVNNYSLY